MDVHKIVTIQDISCYGQCSITVALPILSAYGFETAIIPSAILSTHTSGFKDYHVHDLSDEIPEIIHHWKKEDIKFDCLYVGYLGEKKHFNYVRTIKNELLNKEAPFVLDPVLGDKGKLYPAFNNEYVEGMRLLLKEADIITPNITEASLLTNTPFKDKYDVEYIMSLLKGLKALTNATIILTGVSYEKGTTGVVVYDYNYRYFEHDLIDAEYHGTGDIYTSTFVGNLLRTGDMFKSAAIAAEFVYRSIQNTIDDPNHPYGVKFEPILVDFIKNIR